MKRCINLGILAVAAALSVGSTHAAAANSQSSDAMTITVTIPPFAAGLAARDEGAVGLWTMTDDQSALMVKLPNSLDGSESELEAAVFSSASTPVSVSTSNVGVQIEPVAPTISNGLVGRRFTLRYTGNFTPQINVREDVATVIIAAV